MRLNMATSAIETSRRLHPRVLDFKDYEPEWIARILPQDGLIVIKHVPEAEMTKIAPSGSVLLPQYEGVLGGLEDSKVLRIVAQDEPLIPTTAFKHKSTTKHQDGYQFPSPYRGIAIAGAGNMPDCEVLAYPNVSDERLFEAAGLHSAAVRLPPHLYHLLTQPIFDIANEEYRDRDPYLNSGKTAVIYDDGRGLRFHVGSKIRSKDPEAQFALNVLMEFADEDKHFFWIEAGDVYLIWQRWVCHNAMRSRPKANGEQTVLIRRLLRCSNNF